MWPFRMVRLRGYCLPLRPIIAAAIHVASFALLSPGPAAARGGGPGLLAGAIAGDRSFGAAYFFRGLDDAGGSKLSAPDAPRLGPAGSGTGCRSRGQAAVQSAGGPRAGGGGPRRGGAG